LTTQQAVNGPDCLGITIAPQAEDHRIDHARHGVNAQD